MAREDTSQPPPPPIASTEAPQMVSSVKLPILNKDEAGNKVEVPLVTAQQILARTRERKAKSTLLMAISDEHLARFHRIKDAKTLWAAIKTRFSSNVESKMQKKSWSNISLIIRNKPDIDNLDIDDLYNNLKVYEADIKGFSGSSSNSQNVAFISVESTSRTNELNVAYSGLLLQAIVFRHKVAMLSMRVKRFYKKTGRKLEFNGKEPVDFDKTKVECFSCHRRGYFTRDCKSTRNSGNISRDARNTGYRGRDNGKRSAKEEDENALVVQDRLGYASQLNEKELLVVKEEEVTETVFDNRSSDEENNVANDRFKKGEGYHAVPPPLTRNYIPPKSDLSFAGLDDSIYKFKISETITSLTKYENDAPETSTACEEKPKEDRMAKKSVLPNNVGKGTGHKERRPVWNNVQRINHKKKFAPTAVFTRSGRIPVSAAKPKVIASTSVAKPVNTAGPKEIVNFSKSRSTFNKSHSPIRRSFYNETLHLKRNSTDRVNTAGSKVVSAVKRNGVTAVKTSAGYIWRPRVNSIDQIYKENKWIYTRVDYQALKNKGIVDNRCSRHMTGNKSYLADYQKINDGGFVAFGSSREAVNTACYVLNRALVTKSHNKTPYELLNGRTPRLDFMRLFGCPVTILNTLDPLGKFEGKADEEFLVGYSVTRNQTNKNVGPQDTNGNAGTQDNADAGKEVSDQHYIVLPLWSSISSTFKSSDDKATDDKPKDDTSSKTVEEPVHKEDQAYRDELDSLLSQEKEASDAADAIRKDTSGNFSAGGPSSPNPNAFIPANTLLHVDQDDSQIPDLEDTAELRKADFNNMHSSTVVIPIPTHRVHRGTNHKDYANCLFAKFLSQIEPKKVAQALNDESWVEAMQEELLNKKDERDIAVRNKARLVAQGHRQEEGIDYAEVFAHVARIKAIKIFLAFASFMGFIVYQMDVKSAFLYGTIEEEVEIEFLLFQGKDFDFKDSIDQSVLTHCDGLFVDPTPEMFTKEQPPDYSFPSRFDVYPDDFLEIESDTTFDDDSFDSEGEKIKEAELLIDPLDLPCDILSGDDVLFFPDNEDKVFNPGILSHEKSVKMLTRFTQEKKLVVSYASWLFEDFDPPFYELLFFKEVPYSMRLLPFSSENEEKVFKPGIYTFEKFHCCFLSELSHLCFSVFKVNLIFISLMKIFMFKMDRTILS
nr:hypothetical protein [Tanacetum cinerariifolium]